MPTSCARVVPSIVAAAELANTTIPSRLTTTTPSVLLSTTPLKWPSTLVSRSRSSRTSCRRSLRSSTHTSPSSVANCSRPLCDEVTQAPSDPVPGVLGLRTVKPLLVPYVLLIVGQPGHQPPNLVTTLIQFRLDRPRSVRAGAATPRPAGPGGRRAVTGAPGAPGDGPGHPGGMADDRCLPMFPLSTVLFPYSRVPLHVFEPRYRCMVDDCLAGDGLFGVVLIARGSEVGGGDERLDVGTVASIETAEPQADGRWHLIVAGLGLIRVRQWLDDEPYPRALVHDGATMPTEDGDTLRTAVAELRRCPSPSLRARRGTCRPADILFRRHPRRGRLAPVRVGTCQPLRSTASTRSLQPPTTPGDAARPHPCGR